MKSLVVFRALSLQAEVGTADTKFQKYYYIHQITIMDLTNTPQPTFPSFEIAKQKDNILKFLSYNAIPQNGEKVYDELNLKELPLEDFNEYLREMEQDRNLDITERSGNRKILKITDKGKIFLRNGGYTLNLKAGLNEDLKKAFEEEKKQKKLDLEIISLKAGMKHNKSTRIIAIIALIISGLSFIYLLTKDVLLKLIFPNN